MPHMFIVLHTYIAYLDKVIIFFSMDKVILYAALARML
jgi:hypothetical protein